jgi:hypothetical protein
MVNVRWIVGIVGCVVLVAGAGGARAQTQANITPHLTAARSGFDADGSATPGVRVDQNVSFPTGTVEADSGCAPAGVAMTVLRFSMDTYNDGYENFVLNLHDPNLPQGLFFQLYPGGSYSLTQFAHILLVDANTHQVVASNWKQQFSLASDDTVPYFPNPPARQDPTDEFERGIDDFITSGWYDEYDLQNNHCQFVRIDGVPDGLYDLVVEENAARMVACGPTSDGDCIYDGRMADNAMSIRIRLTNQNLDQNDPFPAYGGVYDTGYVQGVGPAVVASPPAVVSRNLNSYDALFVGTDGNVYSVSEDGTTGVWGGQQLAFQIAGFGHTPTTVAAAATDRIFAQVFMTTAEGDMLQGEWSPTGGYLRVYGLAAGGLGCAGRPVVVASGPQSAMAVWISTQGYVVYSVFDGSQWLQVPGYVTGVGAFPIGQTPALASSGDGMYHLFLRDNNGAVWYQQYFMGAWASSGWTPLGTPAEGPITTDLTAASPHLNRIDVFGATAAHHLQRITGIGTCTGPSCNFSFAGGWVNDMAISGTPDVPYCKYISDCTVIGTRVGSAPTAISTGPEQLEVFFYDLFKRDMLWHLHYDGTLLPVNNAPQTQWFLEDIGRTTVSTAMWPIVAASWAGNTFDVFQNFLNGQIGVRSRR